jgi:hypothetical protein
MPQANYISGTLLLSRNRRKTGKGYEVMIQRRI